MKSELKKLWFRAKEKLSDWRSEDPLMIAPYLSYGNNKEIIIRGRVIENEGIVVRENDGKWENFVNSIKRMESDEAQAVQVLVQYEDKEYNCTTNSEGYFNLSIPTETKIDKNDKLINRTAQLTLPEFVSEDGQPIKEAVNIVFPNQQNKFAIITDMDDTILESHVNSFLKLRLLYETFLKNVHTRLAFENIGEVLEKITSNSKGHQINPIFFISHSPWNLYQLLVHFLEKNSIPKGPFFLRDFGYKKGTEKFEYENHKALAIEHLIKFYPDLQFVLLGDATEHDVDIYLAAFKKYPKRIIKIIIRATEKEKKNAYIQNIIAANSNAPVYLIKHSDEILGIVEV